MQTDGQSFVYGGEEITPPVGNYRLRVLCFTVCVLECQTEQLSFMFWLLGLLQCYGSGEVGDRLGKSRVKREVIHQR